MSFALVRAPRLDRDAFARAAGVHPEIVERLVALGLLDADSDSAGRLCFDVRHVAVVARIQRLRVGLGLNYAACGVVMDLLEHIDELEASMRRTVGDLPAARSVGQSPQVRPSVARAKHITTTTSKRWPR